MLKRTHLNIGDTLTIPAGTEVGVYTDAALTTLAAIYADDGVTPVDNPLTVDAYGEFSYRAANGVYFEKIGSEPAVELRFDDGSGYVSKVSGAEITYSKAGNIDVAIGTLGRIVKRAGTITVANVRLGTAGITGDTTLVVKNGATTVGSITFISGVATGTLTLTNPVLGVNDVLTVDCTAAAATKAKDLSITFLLDLA